VIDFLDVADVPDTEFIITNPPFSLMSKFLDKCIDLGNRFAILCRLEVISTAYFKKIYDEYYLDVLVMTEKFIFKTDDGREVDIGKCAWIINYGASESNLVVV
jgi:hypothetical protein